MATGMTQTSYKINEVKNHAEERLKVLGRRLSILKQKKH